MGTAGNPPHHPLGLNCHPGNHLRQLGATSITKVYCRKVEACRKAEAYRKVDAHQAMDAHMMGTCRKVEACRKAVVMGTHILPKDRH
eukprot:966027-Heterocapsa_arctica.AAC.1